MWCGAGMAALLGVLTATMVSFHKVSPTAAYALVPYFLWSSYAAALTGSIYKRNPSQRGRLSKRAGAAVEDAARDVANAAQVWTELINKVLFNRVLERQGPRLAKARFYRAVHVHARRKQLRGMSPVRPR